MLTGIDVNQRFNYSDPDDKENPTVFVLKPITQSQRFDLGQNVKDGKLILNGKLAFETFLILVDEVRNFNIGSEHIDSAKGPEELKRVFDSMRGQDSISKIFNKSLEIAALSKEEAKN